MRTAGYNSPHPMISMETYACKWLAMAGALFLLLGTASPATAAGWSDAAAGLARDIAAVAGPGTLTLSVRNDSSLGNEDVPQIRRALEVQLDAAGARVSGSASAASEVRVTLSENVAGYLWIASIRQGTDTRVVMRAVARPPAAGAAHPASSLVLRKTLLWSQAPPMLDIAVLDPGGPAARLLVLDSEQVTLLRLNSGHATLEQSFPITHTHPFPRDIRGRLMVGHEHLFDAYLPGTTCRATSSAPAFTCRDNDDPWPLQPGTEQAAFFGAARNFFTGVLTPGVGKQTSTAPFYSAAALTRPGYELWLFAGVDGRVRASDGVNEVVLNAARDWGSNIIAVKSACGPLLLADAPGDDNTADTIRAYEIADREPAPASPPLEFPGPVTAMWSPAGNDTPAAIVHNRKTNLYEAYSLAISCP